MMVLLNVKIDNNKKDENINVSYDFIYKTLSKKGILSPKARKKTIKEFKNKHL